MTHAQMLSLVALLLLMQSTGQLALGKETTQDRASFHSTEKQQEKVLSDKYEPLLKANPDDARLNFEYGQVLSRHGGKSFSQKALRYFRQAVKLEPENKEFLAALGRELVTNKRYAEAVSCFNKAGYETKWIGDFGPDFQEGEMRRLERLKSKPETQPQ